MIHSYLPERQDSSNNLRKHSHNRTLISKLPKWMQLHYTNVIQKLLLMHRPIYYVADGTVLSYFLIGMYAFLQRLLLVSFILQVSWLHCKLWIVNLLWKTWIDWLIDGLLSRHCSAWKVTESLSDMLIVPVIVLTKSTNNRDRVYRFHQKSPCCSSKSVSFSIFSWYNDQTVSTFPSNVTFEMIPCNKNTPICSILNTYTTVSQKKKVRTFNMPEVRWVLWYGLCCKFHTLSSSAKILKIG